MGLICIAQNKIGPPNLMESKESDRKAGYSDPEVPFLPNTAIRPSLDF